MTTSKVKPIQSFGWSFLDNILGQGITFIIGIVLARLLTPHEYGIIGIVMILVAIFNTIVDSGFSSALIRKPDANHTDFNTVFIFNLLLSIILFFVIFFLAPTISRLFNEPLLEDVSRSLAVIVIINAVAIIQRTIFVKKLDFKTQTKISVISSSVSGIIGIVMAFLGFGVWSLVSQLITKQFINTTLLWYFNNWRPDKSFSVKSFKSFFNFGYKLLIAGLIDTIWNQLYLIIIGKFYSATTLGYYTRSNSFGSIFSVNITTVVQRVSYPMFSEIQDNNTALKETFRQVIKTTMLITFILMFGLIATSKSLILILIGDKWFESIKYLQIISLYLMLYPLHAINLNILQVKGRTDLNLKLEMIKKSLLIGPILLGIFINIELMLWGGVIVGIVSFFINSHYTGIFLGYKSSDQIKDLFPSFIISVLMAIITISINHFELNNYLTIIIQIVLGIFIVTNGCKILGIKEYSMILRTVKQLYQNNLNDKLINNNRKSF